MVECGLSLHHLYSNGSCFAATDAQRSNTFFLANFLQCVHQRDDDSGASRANRMPLCTGTAVSPRCCRRRSPGRHAPPSSAPAWSAWSKRRESGRGLIGEAVRMCDVACLRCFRRAIFGAVRPGHLRAVSHVNSSRCCLARRYPVTLTLRRLPLGADAICCSVASLM